MQVFLFIIGAVALVIGVATIGYGIPINQFSFGNTLIVVGTTAAIGGLIVLALGAVVAQLKHLVKHFDGVVAAQRPQQLGRPDAAEHPSGRSAPVAFPPKPMAEPAPQEAKPRKPAPEMPAPVAPRLNASSAAEAPVLRNPDVPPVRQDTSPAPAQAPVISPPVEAPQGEEPARDGRRPRFGFMRSAAREESPEKPSFDGRSSPPPLVPPSVAEPSSPPSEEAPFDEVWPAESKSNDAQHDERRSSAPESPPEDVSDEAVPAAPTPAVTEERPKAAILKSGVVDGMGYTLYVDGSIEAELPQGTLRFASINDLRAHLEKSR